MPKYNDDQCAQCGGIRVAKSTVCMDCLTMEHKRLLIRGMASEMEIKKLKKKNKKLTVLVERLLDHITNTVVHTSDLERTIYLAWLQGKRREQNGKDRIYDNKAR